MAEIRSRIILESPFEFPQWVEMKIVMIMNFRAIAIFRPIKPALRASVWILFLEP